MQSKPNIKVVKFLKIKVESIFFSGKNRRKKIFSVSHKNFFVENDIDPWQVKNS